MMTKTKERPSSELEWIPCDCPKMGLIEYESGDVRPCKKCGGSEWVRREK